MPVSVLRGVGATTATSCWSQAHRCSYESIIGTGFNEVILYLLLFQEQEQPIKAHNYSHQNSQSQRLHSVRVRLSAQNWRCIAVQCPPTAVGITVGDHSTAVGEPWDPAGDGAPAGDSH